MKLGAQFFTLRERCKTNEGLKDAFRRVKEIGYEVAQMSAIWPKDATFLKECVREFDLPITCTHSPFDRIIEDTDALIRDHKEYGCCQIGLGMMPKEYLESIEGCRKFIEIIKEPIKKIEAAGLTFGYHHHHFEFMDIGGSCVFDILLEEAPSMQFILDTYWLKYAGRDCLEYIKLLGRDRLTNIHLKDMKTDNRGAICPCGEGVISFEPIVKLCDSLKIPYALVEQDNAPDLGDEFEQIKTSYNGLKHYFV